VDLVDQRHHHRRGVGVELEVLGELRQQPRPRQVRLDEGEPPAALGRRQALGRDEGAQPRHRQPPHLGDHLGLGIEPAHAMPFRGS
jgi:hypothetical protein